jgi:hypothetical protein
MLRRIAPGASTQTGLRTQQKAFISTLKDPQFLAEVDKCSRSARSMDPVSKKMVNGLYEIEPAVLSRVQQILESK